MSGGELLLVARSGRRITTQPSPEDVQPGDLAHALARIARFGGHAEELYTVAEHCCRVSDLVRARAARDGCSSAFADRAALAGLLHDGAEAYLGDVVAPLKRQLGRAYADLERRFEIAVAKRFGLLTGELRRRRVRQADAVMLATEVIEHHPYVAAQLGEEWVQSAIPPLGCPWHPYYAEEEFLRRLNQLGLSGGEP